MKYLLNENQYFELLNRLNGIVHVDEYGETTIMNIYYDTPDFRMIRSSLEKPLYKEKLRLRTYGVPTGDTNAFVEIKKKYDGTVYKRRIAMPYDNALAYLSGNNEFDPGTQISKEINYLRTTWKDLTPKAIIAYDRTAYAGDEDPDLRITFDRNIRYRIGGLDLKNGAYGKLIIPSDTYLMEVKIAGAVPLELARIFSELKIYKTSFSKYGNAYKEFSSHINIVPAAEKFPAQIKLREGVIKYA